MRQYVGGEREREREREREGGGGEDREIERDREYIFVMGGVGGGEIVQNTLCVMRARLAAR
jgi:hypothetical protein